MFNTKVTKKNLLPHAELLKELAKKERQQGIYPDPEVDLFMKVCTSLLTYSIYMTCTHRSLFLLQ